MTISASGLSLVPSQRPICHEIIKASWRRCISEYRLDPADTSDLACVEASTLKVLHSEMSELLAHTSAILDQVRKVASAAGHIVLISDANGVVVRRHADSSSAQDILRNGFALGSILHEQRAGTNGIGTCIVSRQPITVHADAHFNERFRGFTCSAAPILGSDGAVLAALDMSGHLSNDGGEGGFARHFIRDAAQLMSLLLFRKRHKNDCIVTLSQSEDAALLATNAFVATNEAGRILGATAEGYSTLGVSDLQSLAGASLRDFCNTNIPDLKSLSGCSVRLRTPNGSLAFATAFKNDHPDAVGVRRHRPNPVTAPLDRIAGSDPATGEIVRLCRKLLNTEIPLLLLGETGVGKDTLARAIHAECSRARKPYVAVNCAAIPAELLASELFGYAPGTFTGGTKGGKTGKIAAAGGGTLFLDEIGDMPLDLQAHLLRVLEDHAVTPLGSTQSETVDLRIICATHRDLPDLVRAGHFRTDLYYRIRGAQFTIPPLRHRSDFAALVASVILDEAKSNGLHPSIVTPDALELLRRYPWPGNIRELRNVIRLVLFLHGDEREIRIEHLPQYLLEFTAIDSAKLDTTRLTDAGNLCGTEHDATPNEHGLGGETLQRLTSIAERQKIISVLRVHSWNITDTAKTLGISRATLHRKIRLYAIIASKHQLDR
jgi:sigma-54 dependent transcriptional regulator, acetoin dehydrogenase operon transcriptional activator AcoR